MALSKDDRIAFSKKIAFAPTEVAIVENSKQQILAKQEADQKLDDAHKRLVDGQNDLIHPYQNEFSYLDGNVRTEMTEQIIQDSGNLTRTNFLYPRNRDEYPPSLGEIWKQLKPFALSYGIGKNNLEVFPSTIPKEPDAIAAILSTITQLQTYSLIEQVTGQSCEPGGTCSNPMYTTQATCVLNGETWTPSGMDVIANNAIIQGLMTQLISEVSALKSLALAEQAVILITDPNATRNNQNITAKNNINNTLIPALDLWLSYVSFNTAHGQTTCSGFNSYNPALLGNTKLQTAVINALISALNNRSSFIATRIVQLNTNLGTISQDLMTGEVSGTGLYIDRLRFIQLRLNLLGGSLITVLSNTRALAAQEEQKNNILNAAASYASFLKTSALTAPSNGTRFINVKDASLFAVNDRIYIISESQEEVQAVIQNISGNRIELAQPLAPKYRETELARIYKDS